MNNLRKSFLSLLKSESDSIINSEENVKHYLSEQGYDYDKLKTHGQDLANKLILKAKAIAVREMQQRRFDEAKVKLLAIKNMGEESLDKLQILFQQKFGTRYAFHFRDLQKMGDAEAMNILKEIEILEFLEANQASKDQ